MDFFDRLIDTAQRGFKTYADWDLGKFELDLIKSARADAAAQEKALAPVTTMPAAFNPTTALVLVGALGLGVLLIKKL